MVKAENTQLRLEEVSLFTRLAGHAQRNQRGYPILQDISLEVIKGDRIAIFGATGAGKTSLLRLLNRLVDPSSGKIYLENQEYSQIPALELRSSIVLVPQETKLLGMTVKEALAYPLVLRGLSKQTIQQRLTTWIEQLSIPNDWLGRTEVQLSAGQRQLVAIARALVIQPKILLLDEPTSALDAGTAERLMEILINLSETQETTILMVNHQLELAQRFGERLIYLQEGKIVQNLAANHIDWNNLRESLIAAQKQAEDEWI